MSKTFQKMYYIGGRVFKEIANKKSLNFAKKYAKDNNLDESKIYELSNESELAYLKELLQREDVSKIRTHYKILSISEFTNANGEKIPQCDFECSFAYEENGVLQTITIVDSVYELTKLFILQKTIFDYLGIRHGVYLKVLYLDDDKWVEWHLNDKAPYIEERQALHKKKLAQMKAVRERQKFDRLLRLRDEGKISEKQSQELYRLEKVFRG